MALESLPRGADYSVHVSIPLQSPPSNPTPIPQRINVPLRITLCHPPGAPVPTRVHFNNPDRDIWSYGGHLLDDQKYGHVDKELRDNLVLCMMHEPGHRPTLWDLMRRAERWLTQPDIETDEHMGEWGRDFFGAPAEPEPEPEPESESEEDEDDAQGGQGQQGERKRTKLARRLQRAAEAGLVGMGAMGNAAIMTYGI
jgi:hypothetical protein